MPFKRSQGFLAQAFEKCKIPLSSQTQSESLSNNNNIDDEFDDDEIFTDICNTIDNENETVPIAANIGTKAETSHFQSVINNQRNCSTQHEIKRTKHGNFLSMALSQSIENVKNIPQNQTTPKSNDFDVLKAERDRFQEEVYSVKGQLILNQENQARNISNRDLKIKSLQEELNKIKTEDKKLIESLQSQLQFKDANLMIANQKISQLENSQSIIDKSLKSSEDITQSPFKRPRLNVIHPSVKRNNSFFEANSFNTASTSIKKEHAPTFLQDKVTNIIEKKDDNEMCVEESIFEEHVNILEKEKKNVDLDNIDPSITNDNVLKIEPFDSLLQLPKQEDNLDLLLIVSRHNPPLKCCTLIDCDTLCHYLTLVVNKLIQMISENDLKELEDIKKDSPKKVADLKELKRFLSPQMEKLAVSVRNRYGGLNNSMIKRLVSYKKLQKKYIFINPVYCCSYHYIYSVWETLKKLMYMKSRCSYVISELFVQNVVPGFMTMINSFHYRFCCFADKNDIKNNCLCYNVDLEMKFVQFVLESFLEILSCANEMQTKQIYTELFKSFINLVPLFGTRLDLRITVLKLFTKMCSYNATYRISSIIDEHKKNVCILVIIFHLLTCNCLEINEENRTIELLDNLTFFVTSMCDSGFEWSLECNCLEKLFSLLVHLGRILALDILGDKCHAVYVETLKSLLVSLVQLININGLESSKRLTKQNDYKSFLLTIHIVIKQHLSLFTDFTISDLQIINHYLNILVRSEQD